MKKSDYKYSIQGLIVEMQLTCEDISGKGCDYLLADLTHGEIMDFLTHFNEIHDPTFVAKCRDDLLVEYHQFIEKITDLRS